MKLKTLWLLLFALLTLTPFSNAQTPPQEPTPEQKLVKEITGWVEHTYTDDYYFVILDAQGNVVERLIDLLPGQYSAIYSRPGYPTVIKAFHVFVGRATLLNAPKLVKAETTPLSLQFNFQKAKNLALLIGSNGTPVVDAAYLSAGNYTLVFVAPTFRDTREIKITNATGPLNIPTWFVELPAPKSGEGGAQTPDFTATPTSTTTPSYDPPTTTAPSGPKMCWVNGYTRKNGTRVSGYWRRC